MQRVGIVDDVGFLDQGEITKHVLILGLYHPGPFFAQGEDGVEDIEGRDGHCFGALHAEMHGDEGAGAADASGAVHDDGVLRLIDHPQDLTEGVGAVGDALVGPIDELEMGDFAGFFSQVIVQREAATDEAFDRRELGLQRRQGEEGVGIFDAELLGRLMVPVFIAFGPVGLLDAGQHDDDGDLFGPDHGPELGDGLLGAALASDVGARPEMACDVAGVDVVGSKERGVLRD